MTWLLIIIAAVAGLLLLAPLRRALLTRPIFGLYRRILPAMSQTEKEALEAGSVWWEGELFSGRPDWSKLLAYPQPRLSAVEQSFL
ncbi:MAG: acyl-CoA dehydrogenase, partial [Pseudomonadota bacterium]